MASRSTLLQSKGFTMIELLIVVALLAVIFSLGLFISLDFYKSYAFSSEKNVIISVLQKARSESLNNIDHTRHGVHFESSPSVSYTIFECSDPTCTSYTAPSTSDIVVNASWGLSINSPATPFDVIFNQLNGDCVISTGTNPFNCDPVNQPITINNGNKSYNIGINSQGRIDW